MKSLVMLIAYFSFVRVICDRNKPNIVLIITDDQDIAIGGLEPMIKTKALIGEQGATFMNAFANTPVCCPSRASILTGKYQHNHYVFNNSINGNCSSRSWQTNFENKTFATYMKKSDYVTFYAGKYLNQYGDNTTGDFHHIPEGWDSWVGLLGNSKYYNYTLSINGSQKYFKNKYLTNVIKSYGLQFLESQVASTKPFLLVLAPPAPHEPFTPEKKYEGYFKGIRIPRTPQFNYGNNTDKHWLIRMSPSPLPESLILKLDEFYKSRWEALLSVDDMVEAIIKKLQSLSVLESTYIIFTSDNGFHLGQLSLPWDKRQLYEFDIRVPFLIRGPGVPKNAKIYNPMVLIDLAPSLLDIADISNVEMDGRSIFPIDPNINRSRTFLLEYNGERSTHINKECPLTDLNLSQCTLMVGCKCQDAVNNTYTCIRTLGGMHNYVYCEFTDNENFKEFYDLSSETYQLSNGFELLSKKKIRTLGKHLEKLSHCYGKSC